MKTYLRLIQMQIKSAMQYRGSFFIHCLAKAIGWGADFLMLFVMISQTNSLNGWGEYEMLLLFGIQLEAYSMAGFFFYNTKDKLNLYIREGNFDQVLTRPIDPLLYMMFREFSVGYISNMVVSGAAITMAMVHIGVNRIWKILALFISILGGALIYGGIMMLQIVIGFKTIKSSAVGVVDWVFQMISRYPLSVFSLTLQIFMTFVIPYAFVNYLPAQIVTGPDGFMGLPYWVCFLSLPVGVIFMGVMILLWNVSLKKYCGTGN